MEYQDDTGLGEQTPAPTPTVAELAELANKHLQTNELDKAFPIVCELAGRHDASPTTLVTAGVLALSLLKRERARDFFEQALERDPSHFDAGYNLVLMDLEDSNIDDARRRMDALLRTNPQNAALYNDMAIIRLKQNDLLGAIDCWQDALKVNPNYTLARNNAMEVLLDRRMVPEGKHLLRLNAKAPGVSSASVKEIERWAMHLGQVPEPIEQKERKPKLKGLKIGIFSGLDSFLKDITDHLAVNNEVRTFGGGSKEEMIRTLEWADLAWFEWCDSFIIEATKLPKKCKMVCRLHSYEAFSDLPTQVDWSKVDLLIFVSDAVRELVEPYVEPPVPIVTIKNSLDYERYILPPKKQYGKKIASVGYINYKKNPTLLLYCFKKIHEYDPEYTLHIAGEHRDPRILLYFRHFLRENPLPVHFDGWVENMPEWYADKDFVISTSLFESFHYSIAEGMSSGLMPLIHHWYGAKRLYPEEYLFNDPDGCLDLLKWFEAQDRGSLAEQNRRFIIEQYGLPKQLDKIDEALASLFTSEAKTPTTPVGEMV